MIDRPQHDEPDRVESPAGEPTASSTSPRGRFLTAEQDASAEVGEVRVSNVLQNASAYFLIIGAVAYGLLYVGYDYIYSSAGILPEEIGLDYIGLLTRSIGALLIVSPIVLLFLRNRRVGAISNSSEPAVVRRVDAFISQLTGWIGFFLALAVMIAGMWVLVNLVTAGLAVMTNTSSQFVDEIEDARFAVANGDVGDHSIQILGMTALSVRIEQAEFDWLEAPAVTPGSTTANYLDGGCFSLLGESNGFIIGIDPATEIVLRLPSDKVLLYRGNVPCT